MTERDTEKLPKKPNDGVQAPPAEQKDAVTETALESESKVGSLSAGQAYSVELAMTQPRVVIDRISPRVEGGRYPAKAVVGQTLKVHARIFTDGHNRLAAQVLWRVRATDRWHSSPLSLLGNDHWASQFTPAKTGLHEFVIEAWLDRWQSYHHELQQK